MGKLAYRYSPPSDKQVNNAQTQQGLSKQSGSPTLWRSRAGSLGRFPWPTFEREERVGALSLAVVTGHVQRRVALRVEQVRIGVVQQVALQQLSVAPHSSGREVLRDGFDLHLAPGAHFACGLAH